jgi:uncharacterized protein with ParB-like and HNH nuclease domain
MKSTVQTVLALFENKRRYIVPMFQRQYVWSLERQWRPLWEDIHQKVIERLRWNEKLEDADAEDQLQLKARPPAEHFLGAIVLDLHHTFGNDVPAQLIIDGQQRLTTCQLFLAAVRDSAKERGIDDYLSELGRYTINGGIMAEPVVERYKIWPSKFDQTPFQLIIDAKDFNAIAAQYPEVKKTNPVNVPLLIGAYSFFWRQLEEFLNNDSVSDRLQRQPTIYERVKALFETFQHDLQVVSIELEGQDDPQVIFETLNARGEPLLPSDLLRNYLFWRASRVKEDVESLYETYWKHFDSEFWKKQEKQGRVIRPRVDLFFFNLLQLKTANEVNVARLYYEYKKWSEKTAGYVGVRDELREIHRYSTHLDKLLRPSEETAVGRFSQMLQVFDVKTVFPLVLLFLADGDLSETELGSILVDLESYLVRRQICGLTSQGFNRLFVSWIGKLGEPGRGINHKDLRQIMLAEKANSSIWPDDGKFAQSWVNDPSYPRLKSNGRMEYILRRLELHLRTAKHEQVTVKSGLTVEHVLPQDWIEFWPLPSGAKGRTPIERLKQPDAESEQRDRTLHTIGNLTLLTGSLNTALRNHQFDVKVKQIEGYTLLALNGYFRKQLAEDKGWDETAIGERGRVLFESAREMWPYPASKEETL